jgi:flagellar hook-length control protein FliK
MSMLDALPARAPAPTMASSVGSSSPNSAGEGDGSFAAALADCTGAAGDPSASCNASAGPRVAGEGRTDSGDDVGADAARAEAAAAFAALSLLFAAVPPVVISAESAVNPAADPTLGSATTPPALTAAADTGTAVPEVVVSSMTPTLVTDPSIPPPTAEAATAAGTAATPRPVSPLSINAKTATASSDDVQARSGGLGPSAVATAGEVAAAVGDAAPADSGGPQSGDSGANGGANAAASPERPRVTVPTAGVDVNPAELALATQAVAPPAAAPLERMAAPVALGSLGSTIADLAGQARMGEGTTRVTVPLDPPALGHVTLEIVVRGEQVRVTVHAANADAARVLSTQRDAVAATLGAHGFDLSGFDVGQMPQPRGQSNGRPAGTASTSSDTSFSLEPERPIDAPRAPDDGALRL